MSKHCSGCSGSYLGTAPHCSFMIFNQNSECPCCICIVKVICKTECEPFEDFETYCIDLLGSMSLKGGYKIRGKDHV